MPCCLEIILGAVGAVIGIGQMLLGEHVLTWRRITGRAIVAGGLALAAGSVLLFLPKAPQLLVISLAAACATLGTDGLERLAVSYFKIDRRKDRRSGG